MNRPPPLTGVVRLLLAAAAIICVAPTGCATQLIHAPDQFDFFARPEPASDPWYDQVIEWQERARRDHPSVSIEPPTGLAPRAKRNFRIKQELRDLIGEFEVEQRHALAERISQWARLNGRAHYVADAGEEASDDDDKSDLTIGDYWPTYSELMNSNGDDCDGLDLIAYQLLREFGFPKDQLIRAILMRQRDEANHMVTLWFEDPGDPWVFDATGAATLEFIRFSEVEGWTPTHVFNESTQYTVDKRDGAISRKSALPFATMSRALSRP
jgi:predicted transglutaminase-like cysteine proteinase